MQIGTTKKRRLFRLALAALALGTMEPRSAAADTELFEYGAAMAARQQAGADAPSGEVVGLAYAQVQPAALEAAVARGTVTVTTPDGGPALVFKDAQTTRLDGGILELIATRPEGGQLILVADGEDLAGWIYRGSDVWHVAPQGGGLTAIYQRRLRKGPSHQPAPILRPPAEASPGEASTAGDPQGGAEAARDSGDEIDIMVVYTPAAARGKHNPDVSVRAMISRVNKIYSDSKIDFRLRLVHVSEVDYAEHNGGQDSNRDLDVLTGESPGLESVHRIRDQVGADLVAMLAKLHDVAGRAWTPDFYEQPDRDWSHWGFSITDWDDEESGHHVFAHEVGHNQGGSHDPATLKRTGARPAVAYGHGNCDTSRKRATVMAYAQYRVCEDSIPKFSSPVVWHDGAPTGDDHTHDVRRVLLETAERIANYRPSRDPLTTLPLALPASDLTGPRKRQTFVRVVNRSDRDGDVAITAIDDEGVEHGPITLALEANEATHFNSTDLEEGNLDKGLTGAAGDGEGYWRLRLRTTLEIEAFAYVRTHDGFVTPLHDVVAEEMEADASRYRYRVPFFNHAKNRNQRSWLRLVNPGQAPAKIEISAVDDRADPARGGEVEFTLDEGHAIRLTAQELESGEPDKFTGRLGAGRGKWRLTVSADRPVWVMALLELPTGHLTNLSRGP